MVAQNDASKRARIRKAILRYGHRYPLAADTVGGIVTRWLPRTGFEWAPDHIAEALAELVADGSLRTRPLPDGKILFCVGGKAAGAADGAAKRRRYRAAR